jgi:hypothetical protein
MKFNPITFHVLGGIALLVGCASSHTPYRYVNSTQPTYDAYLTWTGYNGRFPDDPEYDENKVIYFYNGTEMGRGRDGFAKALAAIEQLPPRSVLLVYPEYFLRGVLRSSPIEAPLYPPFWFYRSEFSDVIARRQLTVILSDYDHLGRPLNYWGNLEENATEDRNGAIHRLPNVE